MEKKFTSRASLLDVIIKVTNLIYLLQKEVELLEA